MGALDPLITKQVNNHLDRVDQNQKALSTDYTSPDTALKKLAVVKDVAHKTLSDFLYPSFLEGNIGSRSIHSFLKD